MAKRMSKYWNNYHGTDKTNWIYQRVSELVEINRVCYKQQQEMRRKSNGATSTTNS